MPCPTCNHAMPLIAQERETIHRHCAWCGTLVSLSPDGHAETLVPSLVARCLRFERIITTDARPDPMSLWARLGIRDSIHLQSEPTA